MKPRIVCAANQYNDPNKSIAIGLRHFDDFMINHMIVLGNVVRETGHTQGFVDQFGTFYTREKAWLLAEANNQIIRRVGGDGKELFSENIY